MRLSGGRRLWWRVLIATIGFALFMALGATHTGASGAPHVPVGSTALTANGDGQSDPALVAPAVPSSTGAGETALSAPAAGDGVSTAAASAAIAMALISCLLALTTAGRVRRFQATVARGALRSSPPRRPPSDRVRWSNLTTLDRLGVLRL